MNNTISQKINNLKVEDKVEIINYGSDSIFSKDQLKKSAFKDNPVIKEIKIRDLGKSKQDKVVIDIMPDLVGEKGIIENFIGEKYYVRFENDGYWFKRDQLKKI